jgi:glutathione S-transferase
MRVYGDLRSGNCLKVKYTADHLGLPYEWVDIDTTRDETRTPGFLRRAPMGQVPVVEFEDGRCLSQSNAIIRYLARGSLLIPDDPFLAAKVDELLFWEQYSHEPYIATTRYHVVYLRRGLDQRELWRVERGEKALEFMEDWLQNRSWLVSDAFTIADISLLAYTRLAHEGGFDLTTRPRLRDWIARCERELGLAPASGAPGVA